MIRNKTRNNKKQIFFLLIIANCLIILMSFNLISCNLFTIPKKDLNVEKGKEVEVEIKEGSTLNQIAQLLEEKGIVDNGLVFKLYVQQKGLEKNLLPGKYVFLTGSDYDTVLKTITTKKNIAVYKIVFPEGFTVQQIKQRILNQLPFIEENDLDEALNINNYKEVYSFLNVETDSLEGFLFPKTYEVTIDYSAKNIIEMMLTQFQFETQQLSWENVKQNGLDNLTNYDIIKIASLIEREAYLPEERELISAVIYNRLKIGMSLQIDATIRYALNKWDGIVTYDDLEIDSPYNTYKNLGLPPTPICNPGIASIKAALNPANVDYLYYVVIDEQTHKHKFSNTLEEHEKAKNQN